MRHPSLHRVLATFLFAALAFAVSGWAHADPPARVARLAYASGEVSFSPGGESDWVRATLNRPLITGDRLWADDGARAELQLGGSAIRLDQRTSVALLNVDDRIAQLQLTQGTLNIRVWRLARDQTFEIDTPNLAYSIRSPGSYRIAVDPQRDSTEAMVRAGAADVYGEGAAFAIDAGQGYEFFGTGLRDYDGFPVAGLDEFDRWASERDRRWEDSVSARYVSRDLIGYQDLDEYGTWREVAGYGAVWVPARVEPGWAPYRDGHWAWVEPWGWTWIDDAPWGFAPSHYGRWAHLAGSWCWVPGPVAVRPVYAPALVAFVGGNDFRVSINIGRVGAVGWFPLGPREVYRPSYPVSRDYFTRVNTSNTVMNTVNITNVYNNTNVTNVTYVNRQVPGAVVVVPTTAFVQSRPVASEAVRMSRDTAASAPVMALAPIAPVRTSVLGAAPQRPKPPEAAVQRRVVAKVAPPPAPVPFASRQKELAANPGKPLDAARMAALKPPVTTTAPAVTLIRAPQPVSAPPKEVGPAGRTGAPPAARAAAPVAPHAPPAAAAQPELPRAMPPAPAPQLATPGNAGRRAEESRVRPPAEAERAVRPPIIPPRAVEPRRPASPPVVAPRATEPARPVAPPSEAAIAIEPARPAPPRSAAPVAPPINSGPAHESRPVRPPAIEQAPRNVPPAPESRRAPPAAAAAPRTFEPPRPVPPAVAPTAPAAAVRPAEVPRPTPQAREVPPSHAPNVTPPLPAHPPAAAEARGPRPNAQPGRTNERRDAESEPKGQGQEGQGRRP